jgi:hypothetical protein
VEFKDFLQRYDNYDKYLLFLDSLDIFESDEKLALTAGVTRPTLHNARERWKPVLEALKMVQTENKTYGNKDVNEIVEAFKQSFGTTATSRYDRFAASRLSKTHGTEEIVRVIQVLARYGNNRYAPTVNSISELEKKLVSVGNFIKRIGGTQEVVEL